MQSSEELPPPDCRCEEETADDATAVAGNQSAPVLETAETAQSTVVQDALIPVATVETVDQVEAEADANPPSEEAQTLTENGVSDKDDNTSGDSDGDKKITSSFAQLVKAWEAYVADAQNSDLIQPLQLLQNLQLCGPGQDFARLTLAPSTEFHSAAGQQQDPFEPIILRHTHSTPLQYRSSFFGDNEAASMPPPSTLDPTRRSSSTPSRGSAFRQLGGPSLLGAHLYGGSNLSAFTTLPFQRSHYSGMSTGSGVSSAFDPVTFASVPSRHEPQVENTEIEVMDLGRPEPGSPNEASVVGDTNDATNEDLLDIDSKNSAKKESAAARAARFLSDVGGLRFARKKSAKGDLASASNDTSDSKIKSESEDTSMEPPSKVNRARSTAVQLQINERDGSESESSPPATASYEQLDSDADEDIVQYRSMESEDQPRDKYAVPPLSYQPMADDHSNTNTGSSQRLADGYRRSSSMPAVKIQVSCNTSTLPQIAEQITEFTDFEVGQACMLASSRLVREHGSSLTTTSRTTNSGTTNSGTNSPGTSGSSTSGHTTQATSTASTTGNASGQSVVSETDREVMEANKEGKRRRQQNRDSPEKSESSDGNTVDSSSTTSTNTQSYLVLSGSPGPLRDGANVLADNLFANSSNLPGLNGLPTAYGRSRTSSLSRKFTSNGSPLNFSGSSVANTSCSLNTQESPPPNFVTYLDRQAASDLTSLRGAAESNSPQVEEREESPAQIVGYPVIFEEAQSTESENDPSTAEPMLVLPSKERLYSMLDRFRSRPPRSPAKGLRTRTPTMTPPPRIGSPAYCHQLSPPRNIVDHRIEANVSRPYVVRTHPATRKLVLISPEPSMRPTIPLVGVDSANYSPSQNRQFGVLNSWPEHPVPRRNGTYTEHSIEIMKTDSRDELIGPRDLSGK